MNVKFFFSLVILSFVSNVYSQFLPDDLSLQESPGIPLTILNRSPEKIVTLGSEHIDKTFKEAKVNNGNSFFNLRYNNYSGYFEYKKSPSETTSISKDQNKEISFKDGRNYFLKNYKINKSEKEEYLLLLGIKDSKVKIYKLESIEFIPYKEALNSYQEQKLPEYKLKKPLYFIEYENNVMPIEKNKDLEKAFPNKSKEIKQFLKQNKIDFASDEFLIIQRFLDSIL